jgi:hypothetical protein
MRISIGLTLLVFLLLTNGMNGYTQAGKTSIRGKITLTDSMPATGSKVIARHVPTGSLFAAIADTTGSYRIPDIDTGGPYTLEISLKGYETFTKKDIFLTLNASTIDASLTRKDDKGVKYSAAWLDDSGRNQAENRKKKANRAYR